MTNLQNALALAVRAEIFTQEEADCIYYVMHENEYADWNEWPPAFKAMFEVFFTKS